MTIIHKALECERSGLGEVCFSGIRRVHTIIIIAIIVHILMDRCLSTIPIIHFRDLQEMLLAHHPHYHQAVTWNHWIGHQHLILVNK
jgi:hypothetical protein